MSEICKVFTKQDIQSADLEVAELAVEQLMNLTKTYLDNIKQLSKTYAKEFARLGLASSLCITIGNGKHTMVLGGFGEVINLISTNLAAAKEYMKATHDNENETERG